jgi:hypothetical protein
MNHYLRGTHVDDVDFPWDFFSLILLRYGLLLSGALLAAMPEDQDRQKLMDYTYETWQLLSFVYRNTATLW